jgi:hypothetical protein
MVRVATTGPTNLMASPGLDLARTAGSSETASELAPERSPAAAAARTAGRAAAGATAPVENPMDRAKAITLATLLSGVLDPMSALLGIQGALRDASAAAREQDIELSQAQADQDNRSKLEALAQAEKALKKASSRWPTWAKKLVAAVLTIVGSVASAVTGGTSAVLVAVALVLLLAAKGVEKLAEKGVLTGKAAMGLTIALKAVAAVLMTVAGGVGGAAQLSQVAKLVVDITKVVNDVITQVKDMAVGIRELRRGRALFEADMFQADAEASGVQEEESRQRIESSVDELRQLHQRFQRVLSKIRQTAEERESATLNALAQLGRV